ncbi:hypothetical protein SRHO_G00252490 [Serrasalmus rhombeus]
MSPASTHVGLRARKGKFGTVGPNLSEDVVMKLSATNPVTAAFQHKTAALHLQARVSRDQQRHQICVLFEEKMQNAVAKAFSWPVLTLNVCVFELSARECLGRCFGSFRGFGSAVGLKLLCELSCGLKPSSVQLLCVFSSFKSDKLLCFTNVHFISCHEPKMKFGVVEKVQQSYTA